MAKNESMVAQNGPNKDQEKLVAENGGQKEKSNRHSSDRGIT